MKKFVSVLLVIMILATSLSACGHKHTPGPAATCTEPQVCTECGEILVEATGHIPGPAATCSAPQTCTKCGEVLAPQLMHTPGADATCTEPQTCTVCGEILVQATGHDVGSDGVCTKCGTRIVPEGQKYIAPGKNGAVSDDTSKIIPETQNTGHYNNNIDAYYAGAVLVCGDYSLEYFLPGAEGSSSYADIVNGFAEKYPNINTTCMLVPKSCAFNSPAGYTNPYERTQQFIDATYGMMNDSVKKADCLGVMTDHEGEYMFYRTDHHWTSLGAYYAFSDMAAGLGIEQPWEEYDVFPVTDSFEGTLASKSGCHAVTDVIELYVPKGNLQYYVTVDGERTATMYDREKLEEKDQYAVFLGGNDARVDITTTAETGRTLLIFKDSYANCFLQFLLPYYDRIILLDARYYYGDADSVISREGVTDVLFLYNANTFLTDRVLADVLAP